jgi:hypothetical protein
MEVKDAHLELVHQYVLLQTLEDIIISYCLIFLLIKTALSLSVPNCKLIWFF